ncbi:MAG: glycosyltransferase [Candidatus Eremiobacteraeota bacterium]|nr:glycosyltransferase [Candidatus Eremiobacteraeota bacterium]
MYTALFDPNVTGELFDSARVHPSYLAKIPGANRFFRALAPLYPRAFESFDLSAYDTIISSTTAWAKGVIVPPGAKHICYINTVSRFAFAYDQYIGGFGARSLARPVVARLVEWDIRAASRPTLFVANSQNVARRVLKYYGRESKVLHCPVDIDRFSLGSGAGDYFLIASRLLPYKRIDLAIEAAAIARVPLLIAGTGPAEKALRMLARGTTTTMLGYIDDLRLNQLLGNARAAILPGEEDFGLVPLEAAATGRPTIAYRAGGAQETIREGVTGEFFEVQQPHALAERLRQFDENRYDPQILREHAQRFSPQRFIECLSQLVAEARPSR